MNWKLWQERKSKKFKKWISAFFKSYCTMGTKQKETKKQRLSYGTRFRIHRFTYISQSFPIQSIDSILSELGLSSHYLLQIHACWKGEHNKYGRRDRERQKSHHEFIRMKTITNIIGAARNIRTNEEMMYRILPSWCKFNGYGTSQVIKSFFKK